MFRKIYNNFYQLIEQNKIQECDKKLYQFRDNGIPMNHLVTLLESAKSQVSKDKFAEELERREFHYED